MNLEHNHQVALFRWSALNEKKYPDLALMFAVPNGGHRHKLTAYKLKAEGVKAGVPDLCLPVPRGTYAGLFIEMKAGKNKPTGSQLEWQDRLRRAGHRVEVCYSWMSAANVIEEYLQGAVAATGQEISIKYEPKINFPGFREAEEDNE